MTAEQDWQKFAALLADNDVDSIQEMICEMSADQIKACMTHGAALLRVQEGEAHARPTTPGGSAS